MISNGLTHVIVLEEQKYSRKMIFSVIFIIILGILQIAAGILIEIFSLGAGKKLGLGFNPKLWS